MKISSCNQFLKMTTKVNLVKLNNGKSIPILGLGTWNAKPGKVVEAVKDAIACGYRHLDCAPVYMNEKEVGEGIKAKIDDGTVRREDLFITSKLWLTKFRDDLIMPALKKTLNDLGLQYLDLFLIHFPIGLKETDVISPTNSDETSIFSDIHFTEVWKGLETCHKEGLVKSIGLSNFNKRQISSVLEMATVKPSVNQVECHPHLSQKKLIKFCSESNIVLSAFSPLGSPARPVTNPNDPILLEDPKVKEMAEIYKKDCAQILIRYQIQNGTVVIPKSETKSRIESNFDVFDFEISLSDMDILDSINKNIRLMNFSGRFNTHPDYPFSDEY